MYSTDAAAFSKESGETSLAACERYMERYEAHQVDLTGCTLDQVLYVIKPGLPCDRAGGFEPCGAADGIHYDRYYLY